MGMVVARAPKAMARSRHSPGRNGGKDRRPGQASTSTSSAARTDRRQAAAALNLTLRSRGGFAALGVEVASQHSMEGIVTPGDGWSFVRGPLRANLEHEPRRFPAQA